jgi:hypothetical protein
MIMRRTIALLGAALVVLGIAGCGGGRVRLEMGGLTEAHVPTMAENAVRMQCEPRRGLGRIALRCPGIVYPEETVDMVIWNSGRVECIARRDHEDDCPVIAEALLTAR